MIRDLEQGAPEAKKRTDVCIVGAGAAGIVLALELARRGKSVTLLEGGGRTVETSSQDPYSGASLALPHRGLHEGRMRALGGTTTLWGGQILELDALDFEKRSWIPESGWPFSKSELRRFYARALELEGVAGSLQNDGDVWAEVGERTPDFEGFEAYMSRWCPEPDFARLHREALERDERIDVWLHANATQLLMNGEAAKGIQCRTLTGVEAIFEAAEYCFCLGAIESSRFFLQAREGRLPWNESGLLGRHFQDHVDCDAAIVEPRSEGTFHGLFDAVFLRGYKYNPKLKLSEPPQRERGLLNAGATFYTVSDVDETLIALKTTAKHVMQRRFGEIKPREVWSLLHHSPTLAKQAYRFSVKHRPYHPAGAQIRMRVHCEQEPGSSSSITLGNERDQLGLLRTQLSWHISEAELRTIREFVELAQSSLHGFATIIPDATLRSADGRFLSRCEDSFHHMGGMRMNASPRSGVVDPNLKLHGTKNVSVCSSAVYPTSGFSNPTHTLLALAVRLAERLAA